MSLSSQVHDDLEDGAVWFDEDDFAEYHEVNGATALCELGAMRTRPEKAGRMTGGAHRGSSYVFIRVRDFTRAPKPGETIDIDGVCHKITSVTDDLGVYMIEYRRCDDDKFYRPGA
jgi:hypothetical protein